MKAIKEIKFEAIRYKLRKDYIESYKDTYSLTKKNEKCGDAFMGRMGGNINYNINDFSEIILTNFKSIEKEIPELYFLLTKLKANIIGNKIIGKHKFHNMILFKLTRCLVYQDGVERLLLCNKLIREYNIQVIKALIISTYHIYLKNGFNEYNLLNGGDLFTGNYRFFIYDTNKDKIVERFTLLPIPQRLDSYISNLNKTRVIINTFKYYSILKSAYINNKTQFKNYYYPRAGSFFSNNKRKDISLKKLELNNKICEYIKNSQFKKAANLMKCENYWK